MKKILLTSALATILSSSVIAEENFYMGLNAGVNHMNEKKVADNFKLKSNNSPVVGVKFGYNFMDGISADLGFNHYFDKERKGSHNNATLKAKPQLNVLMVNGKFDVANLGIVRPFITAGVGVASNKVKWTYKSADKDATSSTSSKNKYSAAFKIGGGVETEVTNGMHLGLMVVYDTIGDSKSAKFDSGELKDKDLKLSSHGFNVSGSMRVEF